jgi:hypothetical protein
VGNGLHVSELRVGASAEEPARYRFVVAAGTVRTIGCRGDICTAAAPEHKRSSEVSGSVLLV